MVLVTADEDSVAGDVRIFRRMEKSCIPVLDAVLGASLEMVPLDVFPVSAKSLDCVDEDFVLELSVR